MVAAPDRVSGVAVGSVLRQAFTGAGGRCAAAFDAWLAGMAAGRPGEDAADRACRERFIVARTAAAALGLAALPPALALRGVPSALELVGFIAVASPLAAVALLSRGADLGRAQGFVSAALALFGSAAVGALGEGGAGLLLVLAAVLLDAGLVGSRRTLPPALLAGLAAMPFAAVAPASDSPASALSTVLAVALAVAASHALAAFAVDRRLRALLREARLAGEAREGAAVAVLDDLLTWHDRAGSVLRASPSAARLLRARPSALQGRGLFTRVHVADRPAYLKAIDDAANGADPVIAWLRLACGVGEEGEGRRPPGFVWVEMRAYRLPQGEGPRVVAVSRAMPDEPASAQVRPAAALSNLFPARPPAPHGRPRPLRSDAA